MKENSDIQATKERADGDFNLRNSMLYNAQENALPIISRNANGLAILLGEPIKMNVPMIDIATPNVLALSIFSLKIITATMNRKGMLNCCATIAIEESNPR